MSRVITTPRLREKGTPCTDEEVGELCKAICLLGYPYTREQSARAALKHASLRRVRSGEVVIREGARAHEAFVLRSGRLRVSTRSAHGVRHIAEAGPGDIVGEMGLLTHAPRAATVVAAEDSALFVIHEREFDLLLHSSPEFRLRMEGLARERELGLH